MTYNFKEHLRTILRNDTTRILSEQIGNNASVVRPRKGGPKPGKLTTDRERTARSIDPPCYTCPPDGWGGDWGPGDSWGPCTAGCGEGTNWIIIYHNGVPNGNFDPGPDGAFGTSDDQNWPPGSKLVFDGARVATLADPAGNFPPGMWSRDHRFFYPDLNWCNSPPIQPPPPAQPNGQLVIGPDINGTITWYQMINNTDADGNPCTTCGQTMVPFDWQTILKAEGWVEGDELPLGIQLLMAFLAGLAGGVMGAYVYDKWIKDDDGSTPDSVEPEEPIIIPPAVPPPGLPPGNPPPPVNPPGGEEVPVNPPGGPPTPPTTPPPITFDFGDDDDEDGGPGWA